LIMLLGNATSSK